MKTESHFNESRMFSKMCWNDGNVGIFQKATMTDPFYCTGSL